MRPQWLCPLATIAFALWWAIPALAQAPDEEAMQAEQVAAMDKLAWMDGEWRGTVVSESPAGEIRLTQTERVGPIAGGTARIIEGRGYDANGELAFNAVAMITYDAMADEFVMTTTARGFAGRPWLEVGEESFKWGISGGSFTFTYETELVDGVWSEDGFLQIGEAPRNKFLELRVERIGETTWPQEGFVEAQ